MKREHNSFKTPLIVEVMTSGKRFRLHYAFTYLWKHEYIEIRVHAGVETDFASIPKLLRLIIEKLGKWNKAAVIHDAIYQDEYETPNYFPWRDFTREEADIIFRDGMIDLGVARWQYNLMYWAVRAGGWLAWKKR